MVTDDEELCVHPGTGIVYGQVPRPLWTQPWDYNDAANDELDADYVWDTRQGQIVPFHVDVNEPLVVVAVIKVFGAGWALVLCRGRLGWTRTYTLKNVSEDQTSE